VQHRVDGVRETVYLVLVGLLIGVPAALLGARLISAQLFGMNPLTTLRYE
jgi:hypothetical protein